MKKRVPTAKAANAANTQIKNVWGIVAFSFQRVLPFVSTHPSTKIVQVAHVFMCNLKRKVRGNSGAYKVTCRLGTQNALQASSRQPGRSTGGTEEDEIRNRFAVIY